MPNKDDEMRMINQPFLTEEGFVNQACMNELEAAILNMPETYDRLAGNPEWSIERIVSDTDIVSALASSAIRQFCGCPPNLEKVVSYTLACLRVEVFSKKSAEFRFADLSLCNINKLLWGYLGELDIFLDWNDSKYPSWIDLSALLHNVCISVRDERRRNDDFDKRFEEKYSNGNGQ